MPPAWSMMRIRSTPALRRLGAGQDPGDPPAHDHHVDLVGDRVALDERRERVVAVAGEVLVGPQVADVGPAGDQPLVPLGEVLGPDGLGVVARGSAVAPPPVPVAEMKAPLDRDPGML